MCIDSEVFLQGSCFRDAKAIGREFFFFDSRLLRPPMRLGYTAVSWDADPYNAVDYFYSVNHKPVLPMALKVSVVRVH